MGALATYMHEVCTGATYGPTADTKKGEMLPMRVQWITRKAHAQMYNRVFFLDASSEPGHPFQRIYHKWLSLYNRGTLVIRMETEMLRLLGCRAESSCVVLRSDMKLACCLRISCHPIFVFHGLECSNGLCLHHVRGSAAHPAATCCNILSAFSSLVTHLASR